MGLQFQNEVPFRHVYIHGIVRDKHGKKMSKSLGNVIDPLVIMKEYGTDALRFSLAEASIPGRDMHLSNEAFLKARNFANKLWNASRFVLMNLEGYDPQSSAVTPAQAGVQSDVLDSGLRRNDAWSLADRWILDDLQRTIEQVSAALEAYNPAEASRVLYEFTWGTFCDWYVEISKVALTGEDAECRRRTQAVLVHVLGQALVLLHPVMPYETEAIFQALRPFLPQSAESLMVQSWPKPDSRLRNDAAAAQMRLVQNAVTAIRTIRSEMSIPPGAPIECRIKPSDSEVAKVLTVESVISAIVFLARLQGKDLFLADRDKPVRPYFFNTFAGGEVYVPVGKDLNVAKEAARLTKKLTQLKAAEHRGQVVLQNPDFLARAPQEEIESRKTTLAEIRKQIEWIERNLEGLS
jgi:valyl-tRNA synthetase